MINESGWVAIVLEPPRLELVTALLTAAAACTLIPHSRKPIGSALELSVWIGFLLSSGLCIATFGDPKSQEATAAIAWGVIGLVRVQASFAVGIVGAWTGAHRFAIANWIALAAGVDAFVLAFGVTWRAARRSAPRIHLAEFFELPYPTVRPAYVLASDPLAAVDRRLAAATRTQLGSIRRRVETSPALAKAAVGAAHMLRPGHLRLAMVKLALNVQWRHEELARSAATANRPSINGEPVLPLAGIAKRTRRHSDSRPDSGTGSGASRPRSGARSSKKEGGGRRVPGYRHRVAS